MYFIVECFLEITSFTPLKSCGSNRMILENLGGSCSFKYFSFLPLPGEMIEFDYYFSTGLVQPLPRNRTFNLSKPFNAMISDTEPRTAS